MTHAQLERRVHFLTMYAAGSTLLLLVFSVAAFNPQRASRWEVLHTNAAKVDTLRAVHIVAERLDIVEPDGRLDLVMANTKHMPGAIVRGEELIDHRAGRGIAGMLFYNAEGTEMGGLIFHSNRDRDGYETFGHISFDQYNQDQVVALNYHGTDTSRAAGLRVWDRPTSVAIDEVIEAVQIQRGARRDSAQVSQAQDVLERTRQETAFRVFVGSEDKTAGVHLYDTEGRERIRMVVDSLDRPQLVFLDESGDVVKRFLATE